MLASAGTVFNTLANGLLWVVILVALIVGYLIWLLHRLERYRYERDTARDRHRGTGTQVKEKIARGELGPGGFPIQKKRGKK